MSKKVEQVKKKLGKIQEKINRYEELKRKAQAEFNDQYYLLGQYETEENLKKYKKYIKLGYCFKYTHTTHSDSMYLIISLMPDIFKYVDLDNPDYNKQYTGYYDVMVNAIANYVESKKGDVSIGLGVILYDANKKEVKLN